MRKRDGRLGPARERDRDGKVKRAFARRNPPLYEAGNDYYKVHFRVSLLRRVVDTLPKRESTAWLTDA